VFDAAGISLITDEDQYTRHFEYQKFTELGSLMKPIVLFHKVRQENGLSVPSYVLFSKDGHGLYRSDAAYFALGRPQDILFLDATNSRGVSSGDVMAALKKEDKEYAERLLATSIDKLSKDSDLSSEAFSEKCVDGFDKALRRGVSTCEKTANLTMEKAVCHVEDVRNNLPTDSDELRKHWKDRNSVVINGGLHTKKG